MTMKKASIVSIGDEILNGQTIDTNAAYLSTKLLTLGIPIITSYPIGDDIDLIVRSLKLAAEEPDRRRHHPKRTRKIPQRRTAITG